MSRTKKITFTLLGVVALMVCAHLAVHGLPALSDLNPHG